MTFPLLPAEISARCERSLDRYRDRLTELSHAIHAHPEIAFAEHDAVRRCAEVLAGEGFRVETGVAGLDTAFRAEYGEGELVVVFCAEYDALPELGHACGHNMIAAIGVGAGLLLRDVADELGITVRVLGTPAEESGGGKLVLLGAGVFADAGLCLMAHPAPAENCAPRSLAVLDLKVRYTGRASHAAVAPHAGVNAADALTVAQVAIGLARQHFRPKQMVHGIVTHGGDSPNVIPARTEALFYLRAADLESLAELEKRVVACLQAGATATGCTADIRPDTPAYAELRHDEWLVAAYRTAAEVLGRPLHSPEAERDMPTGSTDMGNVSRVVPSIHPVLAVDCGDAVNHQPEFAAACVSASADRAVGDGALALAWAAAAAAADPVQRARLLNGVRDRA
ncbi:amidase [Lentzea pudingi]|uniref:Peptidase M20 domain-containing protein 2 n=1 Tax=Lentzea pudingi TaxID=1789439 RepID=A0ABQ2HBN0_9PSEU|nr:M20 family metallopeptidase [Lentzea pudingi]GGM73441.1 amidase [Lentzea pudingi]